MATAPGNRRRLCRRDCPVEADMATMKAEFLAHHYQGRLRPRAHYSTGWLPLAARLAARAPKLVNALTQAPALRDAITAAGGIDRRRGPGTELYRGLPLRRQ
jgi:hypothetical protein